MAGLSRIIRRCWLLTFQLVQNKERTLGLLLLVLPMWSNKGYELNLQNHDMWVIEAFKKAMNCCTEVGGEDVYLKLCVIKDR